ncbi:MFS transporter [Streptosporangium sp. NPDC000396]|uniref:MFS transporter n=1 Tax=Streptosporangium sp. NPDC000396 TaxID=3366185 RepID=UPI0036A659C4
MSRDFRLFWTGQTISRFGSVFTAVVLPIIAIRHLGATATDVAVIVAAGTASVLAFGLLAGVWADRVPRRRPYLIACDLVAAATLGVVTVALATGHLAVWVLAGFAFTFGLIGVFIEALYFAHLRSIVGADAVTRARARLQGGEYVGSVLGRVVAGPVVVVGGMVVPLLVDMASYLVNAACLVFIRKPEPPVPGRRGRIDRAELVAGFAALRDEPFLRRLMPFVAVDSFAGGMVSAVQAVFLLTVLAIPTAWYGSLFVLIGVAGAVGTIISDRLVNRFDGRHMAIGGFLGGVAATALLPLASGPLPVAAVVAALGIGLPALFGAISNVGLTGFVTTAVSEEVLGRTSVSMQLITASTRIAGALAGGLVADALGARPTLWAAVILSLLVSLTLLPLARTMPERLVPSGEMNP